MSKRTAFILLVLAGPVLGALYGLVHDQVTYTISEEYYTKFKFGQFRIDETNLVENIGSHKTPEYRALQNERVPVALVGVIATWWVGLIIGLFLALTGLTHPTGKQMWRTGMRGFAITLVTALFIGLLGLLFGKLFLLSNYPNWYYPDNLIDRDAFTLVGSMHNFSYLGGLVGLILAIWYSFRQKRKLQGKIPTFE